MYGDTFYSRHTAQTTLNTHFNETSQSFYSVAVNKLKSMLNGAIKLQACNAISIKFEHRDLRLQDFINQMGTFSVKHDGKIQIKIELRANNKFSVNVRYSKCTKNVQICFMHNSDILKCLFAKNM